MELIIRNTSSQPIYDQIASQIKAQIISGALVRRDLAPAGFQLEKPTIEDIILFLAKGETQ